MILLSPRSPLFPYTTLFRFSLDRLREEVDLAQRRVDIWRDPQPRVLLVRHVGGHDAVLPEQRLPHLSGIHAVKRERSEEHTSELQSPVHLVCRLLLEKKIKIF